MYLLSVSCTYVHTGYAVRCMIHDTAEPGGANVQRPQAPVTIKVVVTDGTRSMRSVADGREAVTLTAMSCFCPLLTASPIPYLPNKALTPIWKAPRIRNTGTQTYVCIHGTHGAADSSCVRCIRSMTSHDVDIFFSSNYRNLFWPSKPQKYRLFGAFRSCPRGFCRQ